MHYHECDFYRVDLDAFDGCPGLDYQGDDDECGQCPYRLENIKKLIATCRKNSNQAKELDFVLSTLMGFSNEIGKLESLAQAKLRHDKDVDAYKRLWKEAGVLITKLPGIVTPHLEGLSEDLEWPSDILRYVNHWAEEAKKYMAEEKFFALATVLQMEDHTNKPNDMERLVNRIRETVVQEGV
jgi:hypothetical protein